MFSGHPILDEIKKGFKLRPTKINDKSKPIIFAEGEDESEVAVTKRAPPSGILPPGQAIPKASFIPPPVPNGFTAPPLNFGPGGIPPPPPMFAGGIPPPPPMMGGIPPPPPMGGAPPPPPPPIGLGVAQTPQPARPKTPINPALAKLGGKTPGTVDRGEFLKGIQGGFKLKKTVTNDKSGLIVDEEMREKSVTLIEAASSSYTAPDRGRSPARPHSSLGFESDDDRFRTARTPEPRDDSPEQLLGQRRPIVMRQKGAPPPPPPEFGFDSEKIKITSEDIEKEIKKGSVASKMAALMGNMGYSAEKCEQVGTGTLPRATFRRSPLRSSMMSSSSEVNNNRDDHDTPKPKPVSKWHVDTNYGLKSASRSNVPLEREERASSVMRDRSSSWLDLTRPSVERARTQSPIPLCERLELDDMDFDELVDTVAAEQAAAAARAPPPPVEKPPPLDKKKTTTTARKKSKQLPEPISVKTEFCTTGARRPSTTPQIQETPPTPAQKKTYGYATSSTTANSKGTNTWRSASPSAVEHSGGMSPISSMSSASAPSPSSLSAGSVSPDSTPKKRTGANPNFEKAKEKWGAVPNAADDSPPMTRGYLMRESKTPTREESTPAREMTPVKTEEPKSKKVTSTSGMNKTKEKEKSPPCFAVTAAEAKGAAAVAKAKTRKKSLKSTVAPAADQMPTQLTTNNKPTSTSVPKPNPTEHSPSPKSSSTTPPKRNSISNSDVKKKTPYGTPQSGTVADRASRFRQQLQADEDKGKKPWQHPFMSFSPSPPPMSSLSAREQLFSSTAPRQYQNRPTQQRVINVPISAPWYSTEPIVNREPPTSQSPVPRLSNADKYSPNAYRISFDEFSVPHPSQMRDHLRFNIDLSHDSPLSVSRR